ncbi:MAG: lysophospholipid acyltransferase family protein [Paludibacteraceae bacterium]|nr:lysophospholipid acyltransferase family protein [Paludibacteraceae bacterium]
MSQENTTSRQWTGKTDGLPWMLTSLIWLLRWIPLQVVYFVVDIVVVFYLFCRPSATKAQYSFFRLHIKQNCLKASWSVYLNMRQFGKVIVDKFAVFAGKQFNIEINNREWLEQCYDSSLPLVMLSAHIGSFELAGAFLKPRNKQMYVLMYGGEKEVIMQNRIKQLTPNNIHIISAQSNSNYLFDINNALMQGNIFAMLADRNLGSNRTITTNILGQAKLPLGPFKTATLREANRCAVFVTKCSTHNYKIYLTPLTADQPNELAQEYAHRLTEIIIQYPNQWFNYYDFWNTSQQ